jgi:hypothetical protein
MEVHVSTAYNRRRGAKANRSRTPRQCARREPPIEIFHSVHEAPGLIESIALVETNRRCIRLADGASQFCSDHRLRAPAQPEGPISRRLRLEHQARQSAEDAKFKGKTHVKMPPWFKAHMRRQRRFLQQHSGKMPHGWKPSWCDHEKDICAQKSIFAKLAQAGLEALGLKPKGTIGKNPWAR